MLSPYKYITHDMEKVQKFVDYIFFSVWIEADVNIPYSLDLFIEAEYNKLINDLYVSNSQTSDKFCRLVEDIYKIVSLFDDGKKELLESYYKTNSNIKNLCEDKSIKPISYKVLEVFDSGLSNKIESFNNLLYGSGSILALKELLNISSFKEHYYKFITENKNRCLFCGLEKLETVENYRSDYDHFLPKAKYPFVSINLKNLAPTCDKCNKKFKGSIDPLYKKDKTTRRKVIYPYSLDKYDFDIGIEILNIQDSKGKIEPENVKVDLQVNTNEETNTWNSVYNIKNRYKSVCSFDDEALNWIDVAKNVMDEDNISLDEYIALEKKRYRGLPWYHEIMFLKIPFLEACKEVNIIEEIECP